MSRIRIERDLAYLLSLSLSLVFFIRPVEESIVIENLPSVKPATKVALFPPLRFTPENHILRIQESRNLLF